MSLCYRISCFPCPRYIACHGRVMSNMLRESEGVDGYIECYWQQLEGYKIVNIWSVDWYRSHNLREKEEMEIWLSQERIELVWHLKGHFYTFKVIHTSNNNAARRFTIVSALYTSQSVSLRVVTDIGTYLEYQMCITVHTGACWPLLHQILDWASLETQWTPHGMLFEKKATHNWGRSWL